MLTIDAGGGGTFGVVIESTILASPQVTLQTVVLTFSPNNTLTEQLWKILVDNGIQFANDSWGGLVNANTAIYINPKLSAADAATSMAPLIQFGNGLVNAKVAGAKLIVTTYPSYGTFFDFLVASDVAVGSSFQGIMIRKFLFCILQAVGQSLALASRLIPRSSFENTSSRSQLVSALTTANDLAPGLIILIGPPSSFQGDGDTSVTPAWRTSIFHITLVTEWNWNATTSQKQGQYALASKAIDNLRAITPDAAYVVGLRFTYSQRDSFRRLLST
jgi:hypothetical protein